MSQDSTQHQSLNKEPGATPSDLMLSYGDMKNSIPSINDGGNIMLHALIDLEENRVVLFEGNGCA